MERKLSSSSRTFVIYYNMITQLIVAGAIILMTLFHHLSEEEESTTSSASHNLKIVTETVDITHILLTSNDEMRFNRTEIIVNEREKIRLTLKHTGKLPKSVKGINFVLLPAGTNLSSFARKAKEAIDNDFIPAEHIIVHTKLIGGGESVSVEFNAPPKGFYDFICSFPSAHGLMKGKFMVK